MSKIVGALVRCKRFYEFSNQPPEFLHGALGAFAQRSFEFRERHLDGIEVWRICWQIAECGAPYYARNYSPDHRRGDALGGHRARTAIHRGGIIYRKTRLH